ncbi:ABC transporter ATP-binding protein [Bacillus sp. FSL W8-0920]|uniref:ABC transporter ATP-binding protein n=1 Tax=Bacillus TaxID=1386 RepID=UPI001B82508E|nr:ABC transporter ATP-binding protein [Bacillus pumilus]MBR0591501.1 ABC transporter ATP-binding protein [Bacillus pumilus sxm20-2]MDR0122670.1 ABC transporter ATP-binding protein [Bacillus pumilus]MED1528354.1 ABC transporter ATP-binding protein [Bacillus pumilus]
MSLLSVRNVTKVFEREKIILDNISLDLEENDITFILGSNGAGKTTLLQILLGLIEKQEGDILFEGKKLNYPLSNEFKRKIGYVSDQPLLIEYLTALENLEYISFIYNVKYTQNDFIEILQRYGLMDVDDKLVKNFSRGMRTKLNLCFLDIIDPMVIYMDEPTIGLDVMSIQYLTSKILEYKKNGKTLLITSHDMAFVMQLAEHIYILHGGIIKRMNDLKVNSSNSLKAFNEYIQSEIKTMNGDIENDF